MLEMGKGTDMGTKGKIFLNVTSSYPEIGQNGIWKKIAFVGLLTTNNRKSLLRAEPDYVRFPLSL